MVDLPGSDAEALERVEINALCRAQTLSSIPPVVDAQEVRWSMHFPHSRSSSMAPSTTSRTTPREEKKSKNVFRNVIGSLGRRSSVPPSREENTSCEDKETNQKNHIQKQDREKVTSVSPTIVPAIIDTSSLQTVYSLHNSDDLEETPQKTSNQGIQNNQEKSFRGFLKRNSLDAQKHLPFKNFRTWRRKDLHPNIIINEPEENIIVDGPKENVILDEGKENIVDEPEENIIVDEREENVAVDEPEDNVIIDEREENTIIEETKENIIVGEREEHVIVNEVEENNVPKYVPLAFAELENMLAEDIEMPLAAKEGRKETLKTLFFYSLAKIDDDELPLSVAIYYSDHLRPLHQRFNFDSNRKEIARFLKMQQHVLSVRRDSIVAIDRSNIEYCRVKGML